MDSEVTPNTRIAFQERGVDQFGRRGWIGRPGWVMRGGMEKATKELQRLRNLRPSGVFHITRQRSHPLCQSSVCSGDGGDFHIYQFDEHIQRLAREISEEESAELAQLARRVRQAGELERLWSWRQQHRESPEEQLIAGLIQVIQEIVPRSIG